MVRMSPWFRSSRPAVVSVALVAALSTGLTLAAPAAGAGQPAATPVVADPELPEVPEQVAEQVLDQAVEVLEGDAAPTPDTPDASMALLELSQALPELEGEDRRTARQLLARPTDGANDRFGDGYQRGVRVRRACTTVCVHWVETSADRVPAADGDGNNRPDQVDRTLAALERVSGAYRAAGYRPPKADGAKGGSPRLDVYLADTGARRIYGYCSPDSNAAEQPSQAGYCVLDNDFRAAQFPGDPRENLKVTSAHEYFHAVQFGYDVTEDVWLMESTATWAESEIYPAIKDNLQYLDASPLSTPAIPLDDGTLARRHFYGAWIFWRHLAERWPEQTGEMASIVREVWDRADAVTNPNGTDATGVQAVGAELRQRGSSWAALLPEFAAANRRPATSYAEGASDAYPAAPLASRATLKRGKRTADLSGRQRHLTTRTSLVQPARGLRRGRWQVRLRFDLPARSSALVTVLRRRGEPTTRTVQLDRAGNGRIRVPFNQKRVRGVEVTTANVDTRYRCWTYAAGRYSCYGTPRGDARHPRSRRLIGKRFAVTARALR